MLFHRPVLKALSRSGLWVSKRGMSRMKATPMNVTDVPYVPVPGANHFGASVPKVEPEPLDRFDLWDTVPKLASKPSSESVRGIPPLRTPERETFINNLGDRARAFSNGGYAIRSEHCGYFVGPRGTGKSFLARRYAAAIVEHLPRFATIVLDARNIDPAQKHLLRPVNAVLHALQVRGFDMSLIPKAAKDGTVAAVAALARVMVEHGVMAQIIIDEAEELWNTDSDDAKEAVDQLCWLSGQLGQSITFLLTGSSLAMSDLIQGNSRNPYVTKAYPLVCRTRDFNSTKTRLLPYSWARFDRLQTARVWYDELVEQSQKSMRPLNDEELQEMVVRTGCVPREMIAFGTDREYAPPRIGNSLTESPLRRYCDDAEFAKLKQTLNLVHNLWMRRNYNLLFGIQPDTTSHFDMPTVDVATPSLVEKWFNSAGVGDEWESADDMSNELRLLLDTGLLTGSPQPWKLWPANINFLRDSRAVHAAWNNVKAPRTPLCPDSVYKTKTTLSRSLVFGMKNGLPHALAEVEHVKHS